MAAAIARCTFTSPQQNKCGAQLAIVNRDETPLDEIADFVTNGAIGEFFGRLNPLLANA